MVTFVGNSGSSLSWLLTSGRAFVFGRIFRTKITALAKSTFSRSSMALLAEQQSKQTAVGEEIEMQFYGYGDERDQNPILRD